MNYRDIISTCYSGDGQEKLAMAAVLAEKYADILLQDASVQTQLALLLDAVEALDRSSSCFS